jgi:prephenate dehydrogenase
MEFKKIAIIGLGLIGGSLAKAIQEKTCISDVTAIINRANYIDEAVTSGVITRGFRDLNEYVYDADIVFLCTPVEISLNYIEKLLPKMKPGSIITDVGSTKGLIMKAVKDLYSAYMKTIGFSKNNDDLPIFIGGHPMAGSEKSGYMATNPHLFENAYYVLTPMNNFKLDEIASDKSISSTSFISLNSLNSLNSLVKLVSDLGAIPVVIDAEEHDNLTGCISHVPHVIASALVNLAKNRETTDEKLKMLAAGGFKDITRIASSDPTLWEGIVRNNKKHVIEILSEFIENLKDFRNNLHNENADNLTEFFRTAREYRDSIPSKKSGLLQRASEITVDVADKPGVLGEIATLLGSNGINIKNLNVSNSREFEHGCLRISLQENENLEESCKLLQEAGFSASVLK